MSNIFKCCIKEERPEVLKMEPNERKEKVQLENNLNKMKELDSVDYVNGNGIKTCPFNGDNNFSVESNNKQSKPNLRLKVPQPLKLKNHLLNEESHDVLHSQEINSFVSLFFLFISVTL